MLRKLVASESQEAKALKQWARANNLPLIHIPNESKFSVKTYIDKKGKKRTYCPGGKNLNAMGREKGFPDYFLYIPRGTYHGLAIELKRRDATLSDCTKEQRDWINKLKIFGYAAHFAMGWEHAKKIIEEYLA